MIITTYKMKQFWTQHEIDYLISNYHNMQTKDIATELNRTVSQVYNKAFLMGLKKSEEYLLSDSSGRLNGKDTRGLKSRFKKGNISWNKGTSGVMKANSGTFKKGNIPANAIHKGSPYVNQRIRNGKLTLTWFIQPTGSSKRYAYLKWLWEKEVKKLNKGELIVFKSEPFFDHPPEIKDLVKITRADNLYRNTGVLEVTDKYVKSKLKRTGIDNPTPELIEVKRNQIILNRKIKTISNG